VQTGGNVNSVKARRRFPAHTLVMPACVVAGVIALVSWAASQPDVETPEEVPYEIDGVVAEADAHLENRWKTAEWVWQFAHWNDEPLPPARPADDLQVLRRLSLALHGTVPSLEEIRQFEADDQPHRLRRWTLRMLEDERFSYYFAERLARGYVGTDGGQFVIYRRDRFVAWLRSQLAQNTPYDEIVRRMIASTGLWTGSPETNFLTATYNQKRFDVNKLAGRSVRAFLGQRLDCAQCHDHPFDERWKQHHFEGLAAFYAQTEISPFGVEDRAFDKQDRPIEYVVKDRITEEDRTVQPGVPFHPEWLPDEGTRREKLAAWITHPENRRFERATVNRVWALLFGRHYTYPAYAVDDLPDPDEPEPQTDTKLLDILGADFREHGYDLRRLILVITSTRAFRLSSRHTLDQPPDSEQTRAEIAQRIEYLENHWGVFPFARLRPEQVIGAMIQANSVRTIDQNSNLFVRFVRAVRENEFVKEYGDPGEEELVETAGTIPQTLLRMNGKLTHETLKATPFSASGRIPAVAGSDRRCIETAFLVVLSRRPTAEELQFLTAGLRDAEGKDAQTRFIEDVYWALFNSPEFSWNH